MKRFAAFLVLALGIAPLLNSAVLAVDVLSVSDPGGIWSYTIYNNEPAGSSNYVSSFTVYVNAPIQVTGTPTGWAADTDNASFVFWFNADASLPYPHDIAPASSHSGFAITSIGSTSSTNSALVSSWDHDLDGPGALSDILFVGSPDTSNVPEPTQSVIVLGLLIALATIKIRKPVDSQPLR